MISWKNFLILLLFLCFSSSIAFANNNYSSASIHLYNEGVNLQNQGKTGLAEQKYLQTLKIQPNFKEARHNLEVLYSNLANNSYHNSNYDEAAYYSKKALAYNSNDVSAMQVLAQVYLKTNQLDNAQQIYKKIVLIAPQDSVANKNLNFISYKKNESMLNDSLNNITNIQTTHTAPKALYKLIKPAPGITQGTIDKTKRILDLLWSEPNGRILLQAMIDKRVPINITQGTLDANTVKSTQKHTLYYLFIPITSFDTTSLCVNLPFNFVVNFNNPNLSSQERIYYFHSFVHEFGHVYRTLRNPGVNNSIEEELGVSMIGYNIAYKIFTGNYLTQTQTQAYSMGCLQALLQDNHSKLPVYSGFNKFIQYMGIQMPYPEIYSDLPQMYKKLLSEGKTKPVPSFYEYMRSY